MQETIRNDSPHKIECKGWVTAQIQDKAINSSARSGSRCMFWHCEVCRSLHRLLTTIFKFIQPKLQYIQLLIMAIFLTSWWSKLLHCFNKQYHVLHKWSNSNPQLASFRSEQISENIKQRLKWCCVLSSQARTDTNLWLKHNTLHKATHES
jgi:hypothetical protein